MFLIVAFMLHAYIDDLSPLEYLPTNEEATELLNKKEKNLFMSIYGDWSFLFFISDCAVFFSQPLKKSVTWGRVFWDGWKGPIF